MRYSRARGFTLIEMIMAMVILAIVAMISVQFISQTTRGYQSAAERQQLATIGWIASEKVSRELRNALPNSIRVHSPDAQGRSACIEFMPVKAGSRYSSAAIVPTAASANLTIVPTPDYGSSDIESSDRVAIYPTSVAAVYSGTSPGPVSVSAVSSVSPASNPTNITLASAHQFSAESPEKRFFIVSAPVAYCFSGGFLYRYDNYGIQSTAGSGLANPVVIANRIDTRVLSNAHFRINPETLTRNAVATMYMRIVNSDGSEAQVVEQEVHIRNVP